MNRGRARSSATRIKRRNKVGRARPGRTRGAKLHRLRRRRPQAGARLKRPRRRRLAVDPVTGAVSGTTEATVRAAYAQGLEQGRYEGGELLLEQSVPPGMLLTGVPLQAVIAAGVETLRPALIPLADAHAVFARMEAALAAGLPLSVVRLGDGEMLALAQDNVMDIATIRSEAPFLAYAGVEVPDLTARNLLAEAVRGADLVGVPLSRKPHFLPLLDPVLRSHGIDVRSLQLTDSLVNYNLHAAGLLARLMQGRRLLVIGNAAHALSERLAAAGFTVTCTISPVRGFADIGRVMAEAGRTDFDLALVSAGIPAVVIAWRLAAELGKVALDFGHMADGIASGKETL